MASPIAYGLGFAGSGIDTATVSPVYVSSAPQWVNSNGGNDSNAGTTPELPVATLGQAITNASANSVILVASGHTQTVSQVTINKAGVRILGFGTGVNRPQFIPTSGATALFNVTANNVIIENIYFKPAAGTSGTGGRVATANTGTQILNCQFDCGTNDQEGVIYSSCANGRVDSCTFTAVSSRPTRALLHNTGACDNFVLNNTTFDGGTFGWAGVACVPASATNLVIKNLTLNNNSDLIASITSYQIIGLTTSTACRVTIS